MPGLGDAKFSRAKVQAWGDSDSDGAIDILCRWWIKGEESVDSSTGAALISGKTGQTIANFMFPGRTMLRTAWHDFQSPDDGRVEGRGLVLQSLQRAEGTEGWAPSESGLGAEWDGLRVLSFGSEGALTIETEIRAAEGDVFCSAPEWIEGRYPGTLYGIACLTKTPGGERARPRILRLDSSPTTTRLKFDRLEASQLETETRWSAIAAELGDADGDGVSDVVFTSAWFAGPGPKNRVVVLSGATGQIIKQFVDHGAGVESFGCDGVPGWGCGFGSSLVVVGDLDKDGCNDIVVGSKKAYLSCGVLIAFSTQSSEVLAVGQASSFEVNELGSDLKIGADFDGDGIRDLVVGEGVMDNGKGGRPHLHIYSGRSLKLLKQLP